MINVTSVMWKGGVKEVEDISRIVQFGVYWVDFPQPIGRKPGIVVSNDYYISYAIRSGIDRRIDVIPITGTIYMENLEYDDDDVIILTMRNYTKKHGQVGDTIQCMASLYNRVSVTPSQIKNQLGMISNVKIRDRIIHSMQSIYSHEIGVSKLEKASTHNYTGGMAEEYQHINDSLYNKELELVKLYYEAKMLNKSDSILRMDAIARFNRFTPSKIQPSMMLDIVKEILVIAIGNDDPISFYNTTELKYRRRLTNVLDYVKKNNLMNPWEFNILENILSSDCPLEPLSCIEKYKSSVLEIKRTMVNMVSSFNVHSKTKIPRYMILELYNYAMELLEWNQQTIIGGFLTDSELSIINVIITLHNFT